METELWKQSYRLPNNLFAMGLTILSYELWKQRIELSKKEIQTAP